MTTNWQEPHGAAPPPPPRNQPNPKRRFAIIGVLLVVIAGLAAAAGLVLVNRGGDDVADEAQYVVMDSPTVTPVFEPRDARGNDPFFPLETQLLTFQQEVEEEIQDMVDEQVMAAEASGEENVTIEVPTFNVAELDAAVKTGLYGGTEENTCDPERLISFLIANPEIGEAWAAVQGIPFSAIPSYIRSLEVRVLAEPVNVLNHGYDPVTGAAYEIDAVLDAGTAVLVDENGDIRTRCYCGNPIKPKPPVGHMPPRCIVFGASVFIVPGGGAKREDAPRDVLLTGKETTLEGGAHWTEVKWGNNDDQKGWVETWNLRKHYCPPPEVDVKCPGPDTTNVFANDRTTVVGQVTGAINTVAGPQDMFGPIDPVGFPGDETIVDGFLLVHFTQAFPSVQNSGWVKLADLQNDDCFEIPMCIDLQDNFVRDRAGGAVLGADLTGRLNVRFTGHFAAAPGDWAEVDILDGSGRTGWLPKLWVTPLADADCEREYNDCIAQALVWDASTGGNIVAIVADGRVAYDAPPVVQDGRVQIHLPGNGPTGWIDEVAALTPGVDDCTRRACVAMPGTGYEIWTNGPGTVGPLGGAFYVDYLGIIANDGVDNYYRISYLGTDYWIDVNGLIPLSEDRCRNLTPECPQTPYRSAIDEFAPDRLRIARIDLDTEMRDTMTPEDERPQPITTCCVTALFIAPNGALAPATEFPAYVTVIDSQDVGGVIWFLTSTGRYFTLADVDFTERACQTPDCPDDLRTPGIREVLDRVRDDEGIVLAPLTVAVDPITPDLDVDGGDCCVRALYFDMALSLIVPVPGPHLVEVEAGPFAGNVYRTTTGEYFNAAHVLPLSFCDGPVDCPTDDVQVLERERLRFDDEVDVQFLTVVDGPVSAECCVQGNYYDDAAGALMGTWDAPTKVSILDTDGTWFLVTTTDSMPAIAAWVQADAFISIDECNSDVVEPGCPQFSFIRLDDDGREVCCIQFVDGGFAEATLTGEIFTVDGDDAPVSYNTVEHGWIEEGDFLFVGAGRCDADDERPCPIESIVSAANPNECCVAIQGAQFELVTITGEVRDIGGGVLEYNTVDHGWILESQFADAGRCEPNDPCPNGQLINGICCAQGQELFSGQCVDPCPTGSTRNPNTGRCVFPQPNPTPEPQPTPEACASGLVDAAGNCCASGQVLVNGACLNPCDLFGGDVDEDGICGDEDACPRDPTNTCLDDPCLDLGGDTDGDDICDEFDNCPRIPNPDQRDSDGNGIGDACDRPVDPCFDLGGDFDNDGICDQLDPCVVTGSVVSDIDQDGVPDECDICPTEYNPGYPQEYPYPGNQCIPLTFVPGTGQTGPPNN